MKEEYVVVFDDGNYEYFTHSELLFSVKENELSSKDRIFKIAEEYTVKNNLVKINNKTK